MTICKYCGKEQLSEFCNSTCRAKYDNFINKENKIKKGFFVAIIISIILSIVAFIYSGNLGIFVLAASVGVSFIIFPLATPQTVCSFGVKKSILTVRICGVICIFVGLIIALL
ncbi:MAG: hypothetical protein RBR05_06420 [Candidatus Methanomethylophilaceae archaeon]|nr:hypothetical protein [Candidatus Methanomethylophilaceae archaeon]MDY0225006.1 hypothetical protein [Candidatus Methanomethylophilaceae archaeon]